MEIELTLVNAVADARTVDVSLALQIESSQGSSPLEVWRTITCKPNCQRVVLFNRSLRLALESPSGNRSDRVCRWKGSSFVIRDGPGEVGHMVRTSPGTAQGVKVRNGRYCGARRLVALDHERVVGRSSWLQPGDEMELLSEPMLWAARGVGIGDGGQARDARSTHCSSFNLTGIQRARLVIGGGGIDRDAAPYHIRMDSVERY